MQKIKNIGTIMKVRKFGHNCCRSYVINSKNFTHALLY